MKIESEWADWATGSSPLLRFAAHEPRPVQQVLGRGSVASSGTRSFEIFRLVAGRRTGTRSLGRRRELERGPEAADLSGPRSAQEDEGAGAGRSHGRRRFGNGRPDSGNCVSVRPE